MDTTDTHTVKSSPYMPYPGLWLKAYHRPEVSATRILFIPSKGPRGKSSSVEEEENISESVSGSHGVKAGGGE